MRAAAACMGGGFNAEQEYHIAVLTSVAGLVVHMLQFSCRSCWNFEDSETCTLKFKVVADLTKLLRWVAHATSSQHSFLQSVLLTAGFPRIVPLLHLMFSHCATSYHKVPLAVTCVLTHSMRTCKWHALIGKKRRRRLERSNPIPYCLLLTSSVPSSSQSPFLPSGYRDS